MSGLDLVSFDGFLLVAGVMGLLKFLYEVAKTYKSYQENRYFSLDRIKEAFETERIDTSLKQQLIDTYEKEIFHKVYKLNVGKKYRKKIIATSIADNGIDCDTFRKARGYLKFEDDNIVLEYRDIYVLQKLENRFSAIFFYILFIICFIGFFVQFINHGDLSVFFNKITGKYIFLFIACYSIIAAVFCSRKEVALESVIKLKKLEKLHLDTYSVVQANNWIDKIIRKTLKNFGVVTESRTLNHPPNPSHNPTTNNQPDRNN